MPYVHRTAGAIDACFEHPVAGFAAVGIGMEAVQWGKVGQIVMSWVVSPLVSGVIAFVIFRTVQMLILDRADPIERARRWVPVYMLVAAFLVVAFQAVAALAAAKAAGANPEVEFANSCTDASFYPQIEVPTVVFGPGSITQAHTKDEWISLEQLEMGVKAYEGLILGRE